MGTSYSGITLTSVLVPSNFSIFQDVHHSQLWHGNQLLWYHTHLRPGTQQFLYISGCSSLPTVAWEPVTLVPHSPPSWYPAIPLYFRMFITLNCGMGTSYSGITLTNVLVPSNSSLFQDVHHFQLWHGNQLLWYHTHLCPGTQQFLYISGCSSLPTVAWEPVTLVSHSPTSWYPAIPLYFRMFITSNCGMGTSYSGTRLTSVLVPSNSSIFQDVHHFQLWHGNQLLWYHTHLRPGTQQFLYISGCSSLPTVAWEPVTLVPHLPLSWYPAIPLYFRMFITSNCGMGTSYSGTTLTSVLVPSNSSIFQDVHHSQLWHGNQLLWYHTHLRPGTQQFLYISGCSSLPTVAWEPVTLVPHSPTSWYPAIPLYFRMFITSNCGMGTSYSGTTLTSVLVPSNSSIFQDVHHFQLWHGNQLLWYHTHLRPGTQQFLYISGCSSLSTVAWEPVTLVPHSPPSWYPAISLYFRMFITSNCGMGTSYSGTTLTSVLVPSNSSIFQDVHHSQLWHGNQLLWYHTHLRPGTQQFLYISACSSLPTVAWEPVTLVSHSPPSWYPAIPLYFRMFITSNCGMGTSYSGTTLTSVLVPSNSSIFQDVHHSTVAWEPVTLVSHSPPSWYPAIPLYFRMFITSNCGMGTSYSGTTLTSVLVPSNSFIFQDVHHFQLWHGNQLLWYHTHLSPGTQQFLYISACSSLPTLQWEPVTLVSHSPQAWYPAIPLYFRMFITSNSGMGTSYSGTTLTSVLVPSNSSIFQDVHHFQLWHGNQLLWYHTHLRPGTQQFHYISGCSSLPTLAWEPVTLVPHSPEAWYPAISR